MIRIGSLVNMKHDDYQMRVLQVDGDRIYVLGTVSGWQGWVPVRSVYSGSVDARNHFPCARWR